MLWETEPGPDEAAKSIVRAAAAWEAGMWAVFAVAESKGGALVGGVNLRLGEHEIAEVSYFLAPEARGRGHATRAVRLLARWAFEALGVQRLELRTELWNEASQRVAERAGFMREGIERASRAAPDGSRFDSVLFSLLPLD
jgi:RimJ/RimL family protein N-acetyltransferase